MMVAEVFSTHERLASISIMNILLFTTSFFAVFLDRYGSEQMHLDCD